MIREFSSLKSERANCSILLCAQHVVKRRARAIVHAGSLLLMSFGSTDEKRFVTISFKTDAAHVYEEIRTFAGRPLVIFCAALSNTDVGRQARPSYSWGPRRVRTRADSGADQSGRGCGTSSWPAGWSPEKAGHPEQDRHGAGDVRRRRTIDQRDLPDVGRVGSDVVPGNHRTQMDESCLNRKALKVAFSVHTLITIYRRRDCQTPPQWCSHRRQMHPFRMDMYCQCQRLLERRSRTQ